MIWTTTTPTKSGYYWVRVDAQDEDPIIVLIEPSRVGFLASSCGSENLVPIGNLDREWLGPILSAPAGTSESESER